MKTTIERKIITEKEVDLVLNKLKAKLMKKGEKKGMVGFVDHIHCMGKILEEFNEVSVESHNKDINKFIDECYDLAITSLFSIMSLN